MLTNKKLYDFSQWELSEYTEEWSQLYNSEIQTTSINLTREEKDSLSGYPEVGSTIDVKHLSLGENGFLVPEIKSIIVRKFYEDLYEVISKGERRTITGSPGIGKTVSLVYFLYRLAREHLSSREGANPNVILVGGLQGSLWYLFCEDEMYETEDIMVRNYKLFMSSVYCLFDYGRREYTPISHFSKTFVFLSPMREYHESLGRYKKEECIYMPVWTLQEMIVARNISFCNELDHPTMISRFCIFGGIPRYVFGNEKYEKNLDYLGRWIKCFNIESLKSLSNIHENLSTNHFLLHMKVDQDCWHNYEFDFASDYVFDQLMEQFYPRSKSNIEIFLSSTYYKKEVGLLYGRIFESFVIKEFENGGSYPCRRLFPDGRPQDQSSKEMIEIRPDGVKCESFGLLNDRQTLGEKTLYVPKEKNNAAFDAFIPSVGGFQMTKSLSHEICERGLKKLLPLVEPQRLYFVIPSEELFDKYTARKIVNTGAIVPAEKYPGLEQYCILFITRECVYRNIKRLRAET